MAYITEVTYTQSGNTNLVFTITFPFIHPDHVKVQVDGQTKTKDTDYTVSGTSLTFVTGVLGTGTNVIRIYRDTDICDPLIVFQTGSSIRANDLNDLTQQLLYSIQEHYTLFQGGSGIVLTLGDKNHITVNAHSDWTINNNVISNAMMLDNSVGSSELINLSVLTSKISDDAVTYGKMQDVAADHRLLGRDDSQTGQSSGTVAEVMVATDHIENDAVTYPKMQDIVTAQRVLGRATAGEVQEVQVTWEMLTDHAKISLATPTATVIWYAASTPPSGYLKANGDTIPNGSGTVQGVTADFSNLYAVVGATLPDLRGEFIRALDDGRGVDSGRAIKSAQTDETGEHSHYMMINEHDVDTGEGVLNKIGSSYPIMLDFGNGNHGNDNHEYNIAGVSDTAAHEPYVGRTGKTGSTGGNRPRNVALLACIKY